MGPRPVRDILVEPVLSGYVLWTFGSGEIFWLVGLLALSVRKQEGIGASWLVIVEMDLSMAVLSAEQSYSVYSDNITSYFLDPVYKGSRFII